MTLFAQLLFFSRHGTEKFEKSKKTVFWGNFFGNRRLTHFALWQ